VLLATTTRPEILNLVESIQKSSTKHIKLLSKSAKTGILSLGAAPQPKTLMVLADLHRPDEPRPLVAAREGADHADDISARAIELEDDDEAQFLRTQKRVPVRRSPLGKKAQSRVKKALVISGILFVFSSAAVAAYNYGIHSWRFRLDSSENIEITGVQNAARAQVMDVIGGDIGRNIFFVPLDERKKQLEQIPWVESATVMRLLPNRVAIRIQERTPVAFARIGTKVHLIDANGVILGMPARR